MASYLCSDILHKLPGRRLIRNQQAPTHDGMDTIALSRRSDEHHL